MTTSQNRTLLQIAKSYFVSVIASWIAKSYHLTQIARNVVRIYDNDGNSNMYTNGEFRLLSLLVANSREGVFFDVGANRGDWSAEALALDFLGRLVAVDPLPRNIEAIKRRFSGRSNVTPLQYALSDTIGDLEFFSNWDEKESGTDSLFDMNRIGYAPNVTAVKVRCTTLPSIMGQLGLPKIDFLKIDVEGNEYFVLRGAHPLLAQELIDFIQIEYGHAARAAKVYLHDIVNLVKKYPYDIFVIKPRGLLPLNFTPFVENRYSMINLLIVRRAVLSELRLNILCR